MQLRPFTLVTVLSDFKAMYRHIKKYGKDFGVSIDTETTGLHVIRDRIILIPITCHDKHFVIPVRMQTLPNAPLKLVKKYVGRILRDSSLIKWGWNFKFDWHMFVNDGMKVVNYKDALTANWLLDENKPNSLKVRCRDVGLDLEKFPFSEYFRLRKIWDDWHHPERPPHWGKKPLKRDYKKEGGEEAYWCALEEWDNKRTVFKQWKKSHRALTPKVEARLRELELHMLNYAYEDTLATDALARHAVKGFRKEDPKIEKVFHKIWNPFIGVLFRMERRGMCLDMERIKSIQKECAKRIKKAAANCYRIAGQVFKIDSADDLSRILYDEMCIPTQMVTKKGKPSTGAESLKLIARIPKDKHCKFGMPGFVPRYPLADAILKYRKFNKFYGTYVGPDSKMMKGVVDGRVHPTFNPCGTDTGRLSSQNPNGQNIPRNSEDNFNFRNCFIAPFGYLMFVADQSQIELRLTADKTGDDQLCAAYIEDRDVHQQTLDLTGVPERTIAKNLNFGAIYGAMSKKFARMLTINTGRRVTTDEAQEYLDAFFRVYDDIKPYQERLIKRAKKEPDCSVRTYLGRKRRLPDLKSEDFWEYARAERQSFNAVIQGGVADIMTVCMLRFDRDKWMRKHKCYLVGQVHDEVHVIAPWDTDIKELTRRIQAIFEDPFKGFKFKVPLKFSCCPKLLPSWGEAK